MKLICKFFVLLVIFASLDGKQFRCDYNYYKEADGWLKIHIIPANWQEARLRCHLEGAALATPTPELKYAIRHEMIRYNSPSFGVFTGIHATYSKGDYFSLEGVPLADIPHNWTHAEPNNKSDKESCIVMLLDTSLSDEKCDDTFPYVCYRKSGNEFVNNCGTVDSEYVLDSKTGSCYKFHRNPRPWSIAHMSCAAEGGHLAIINSETEAQVIKELYEKNPENKIKGQFYNNVAFVGFQYWNESGEWTTIQGETLEQAGYDKFSSGEPNNAAPGEYCGGVYRNGQLDDTWCDKFHPFICEKKPSSLLCTDETD